ncbi:hypothetical protein GCM10027160_06610 [Streptomyces calidiresistens]|uniref:Uncharacterized protein n=1 Tax=Streptomyces calidiresistens TaxID=1485586 RepID=A0A7W3SZN0_9ACTN|nr:hypothetical protein [Streptomyces calidiresistens]MBB0228166.1 hypothetical protein [Streptomyces calidiresistens]
MGSPRGSTPGPGPGGIVVPVLFGGVGAAVALVAGGTGPTALVAGAGIAVVVWLVTAGTALLTRSAGRSTGRSAAEPPSAGIPADVRPWLTRAASAADDLTRHAATVPSLTGAAEYVRTAVDRLHARARAVAVIDAASGDTDSRRLRGEHRRLTEEAAALPGGPLRRAKEEAAGAALERADARERREELRALLLATLESTALRAEAAAERGATIVSLRAAGDVPDEQLDLGPVDTELRAVQAGLDRLEEITRNLASDEGRDGRA